MPRSWWTVTVSGTVWLLALSTASGQPSDTVSDAQIVRNLAPELDDAQPGRIEGLSEGRRRVIGTEEEVRVGTEEGLGFRFERDLNSDGQQELIFLGNYAEGDRRKSFVLIASAAAGDRVRAHLFTFDEEFVVGRFGRSATRPTDLAVFFCTGCDYGGWIEWTGADFAYEPFPPAGVD
jgi:hypothetical protein